MSSVPLSSDETYGSTAEDRSGAEATEPTSQAQSQSQSQQVDAGADKGNASQGSQTVKIRMISMDGNELHFRIKRSTKMEKLMRVYAGRCGLELASLRFIFDSQRIKNDDTPESLDMEEGDIVDVASEQVGGDGPPFGF